MNNERLWAPWRMEYIMNEEKQNECIFCVAARSGEGFILDRDPMTVVLLNKYPYTTGHLMVAPSRHCADINELTVEESHALMDGIRRCEQILRQEYSPHGMNIGINIGHCGGAGIPAHIHVHLVPRWMGDTNFMPVVGSVRVLPEALDTTMQRLRPYFRGAEQQE
jgi:ATP adenylyltransferase